MASQMTIHASSGLHVPGPWVARPVTSNTTEPAVRLTKVTPRGDTSRRRLIDRPIREEAALANRQTRRAARPAGCRGTLPIGKKKAATPTLASNTPAPWIAAGRSPPKPRLGGGAEARAGAGG